MLLKTAPLTAIAVALLGASAPAQSVILEVEGRRSAEFFGFSMRFVGDVDGDGVADLLAGAPQEDGAISNEGAVYLHSGADGALLARHGGQFSSQLFGASVTGLGDLDGDGHADFAVGSPGYLNTDESAGGVTAISGRDGSILFAHVGVDRDRMGFDVDDAGDVNRDGSRDLIVGMPGANGNSTGAAVVFSGADGSLLYRFDGTRAWGQFGTSVAGIGDVDQDGHDDVAVGVPVLSNGTQEGNVLVYSGATGSWMRTYNGPYLERFGTSVAGAGDVNGDGVEDAIVGCPGFDAGGDLQADRGRIEVRSGLDGTVLFSAEGDADKDALGWSVAGAGDVDGDGKADLIAGAPMWNKGAPNRDGYARLYSGATGAVLYTFRYRKQDGQLGYAVAPAGDLDGDGHADFATSEPTTDQGAARIGIVRVHAGRRLFLQVPRLAGEGDAIEMTVREGPAGGPAVVMVVRVNGQPTGVPFAPGQFDATGTYTLQTTVPPGLAGTVLRLRCFACEDPTLHRGVISTVGERLTIR